MVFLNEMCQKHAARLWLVLNGKGFFTKGFGKYRRVLTRRSHLASLQRVLVGDKKAFARALRYHSRL